MRKNTLFTTFIFSLFVYPIFAQITRGGTCSNAIVITEGRHLVDTIAVQSAVLLGATKAKWFRYTPTQSGLMTVASCYGEKDTRLGIFTGTCSNLVFSGGNDDACAIDTFELDTFAAAYQKFVRGGTPYYIVWDNAWDSSRFEFTLTLQTNFTPTTGQSCATAIPLPALNGIYRVDSMTGMPSHTDAGRAIWYKFIPPKNGRISVATCNELEDTRLWIHKGTCNTLSIVGEGDDDCPAFFGDNYNRAAAVRNMPVTSGSIYYIEFDDIFSIRPFRFTFTYENTTETNDPNTTLAERLVIYPNPVHHLLNIDYQFENATNLKIRLFNALGQLVLMREFSELLRGGTLLSVADLDKGIYFIEFTDHLGGKTMKKFVKE